MNGAGMLRKAALLTTTTLTIAISAAPAVAQSRPINVPAQAASTAVSDLAKQTGTQILLTGRAADGVRTRPVRGNLSVDNALSAMFAGTELRARKTGPQTYTIVAVGADTPGEALASSELASLDSPEILVTAQFRSQRLVDVPMTMIALSGEELEKRNVRTILDVVRESPGVAIQDQGVGQRRVFMRGIGNVFGTSSLVGLYLDDAAVTGIQDGEIDLRPYDLERVEVLKGPQGTLYGEGSTAGAIRFITNKPDLLEVAGSADYALSFTKDGGTSHEVTGMFNLPLVNEKLGIRLSGMFQNAAGWIDQPLQSRNNINDQEMIDLRMITLFRPTEDLSVRLTGILHRNNAGAANTVSNRQGEFFQVLGQSASQTSDDDYTFGNATITYQVGMVQLLSSTTRFSVDKELYNQGSAVPIAPPPAPSIEIFGDRQRDADVFSQEFRASSAQNKLTWLVGGYYRHARSSLDMQLQAGFGVPAFPIVRSTTQKTRAWSVFGNIGYAFSDRLELGAGLRYFHDRRETDDGVTLQKGSFESVSPRIYAKYAIAETTNLYTSVAKGFRSGGFNSFGQPNYDPESAWTYEIGLKHDSQETGFNAELSVFQTDYKNVQILSITDPVTLAAQFSNAGAARVRGVEGNVSVEVANAWEMGANVSYSPSEFTSVRPQSTHAVGDSLDMVPEYNANVWTGYTIDLGDGKSLYARLDYSIQGKSSYRNRTAGAFFLGRSDTIGILNASVEGRFGAWRVEAFASNLLNERGYIDPTIIEGYATQLRPRTIGVSIATRFGR